MAFQRPTTKFHWPRDLCLTSLNFELNRREKGNLFRHSLNVELREDFSEISPRSDEGEKYFDQQRIDSQKRSSIHSFERIMMCHEHSSLSYSSKNEKFSVNEFS